MCLVRVAMVRVAMGRVRQTVDGGGGGDGNGSDVVCTGFACISAFFTITIAIAETVRECSKGKAFWKES